MTSTTAGFTPYLLDAIKTMAYLIDPNHCPWFMPLLFHVGAWKDRRDDRHSIFRVMGCLVKQSSQMVTHPTLSHTGAGAVNQHNWLWITKCQVKYTETKSVNGFLKSRVIKYISYSATKLESYVSMLGTGKDNNSFEVEHEQFEG